MPIDIKAVPHYVVLVDEFQRYALNQDKVILGEPSDDLVALARQRDVRIPLDSKAWVQFSRDVGLSPKERERHCCYVIVSGRETEGELQRLIDMQ